LVFEKNIVDEAEPYVDVEAFRDRYIAFSLSASEGCRFNEGFSNGDAKDDGENDVAGEAGRSGLTPGVGGSANGSQANSGGAVRRVKGEEIGHRVT
jgi:hypothetical protein